MSDELKRSEIECKFECNELTLHEFTSFMGHEFPWLMREYKKVAGWDAYYVQGDNVVRHRVDGRRKRSVLTVKRRKSEDSLIDRHEIDMPVADQVPPADVTGFLLMTGWKHLFTINKESFIYHVDEVEPKASVCVALYDVWTDAQEREDGRRFLEIEVEKDSDISMKEAKKLLEDWKELFQVAFGFDDPLNQSLFEMYRPT